MTEIGQAVGDIAAAISGLLVHVGDQLELYRAMADAGPVTPEALADHTATALRYVHEWLINQAAYGYLTYRPQDGTFELPAEHAAVLADENGPVFLGGANEGIACCDAFRTGTGVGWEQHDGRLFSGVRRLFNPSYAAYLTTEWIPALDDVEAKLRRARASPMSAVAWEPRRSSWPKAFPRSKFRRLRLSRPSIEDTRKSTADAALNHRVRSETATAAAFSDAGFDRICLFDCLHDDMGDPVGVARHIRQALVGDGTLMLVEPYGGDTLAENLTPVGPDVLAACPP